jgi:hypothetical protein
MWISGYVAMWLLWFYLLYRVGRMISWGIDRLRGVK